MESSRIYISCCIVRGRLANSTVGRHTSQLCGRDVLLAESGCQLRIDLDSANLIITVVRINLLFASTNHQPPPQVLSSHRQPDLPIRQGQPDERVEFGRLYTLCSSFPRGNASCCPRLNEPPPSKSTARPTRSRAVRGQLSSNSLSRPVEPSITSSLF